MAIDEPASARRRRTRSALLAAARELLEQDGFDKLSMAAVAEHAGVSRRAVYTQFESRSDLVAALLQYVAETEGLAESTRPVWEARDAVTALDAWAQHLARYLPRSLAVMRAIERVRHVDPDAERHYHEVRVAQHEACRRLVAWLHRERRLVSAWTIESAADMLWCLVSTDSIEGLIVGRYWSQERLTDHLRLLFRLAFVRPPDAASD